jgi:hypothetical protein
MSNETKKREPLTYNVRDEFDLNYPPGTYFSTLPGSMIEGCLNADEPEPEPPLKAYLDLASAVIENSNKGLMDFVMGTDLQHHMMWQLLNDYRCHAYRCRLPEGCSPETAYIGLKTAGGIYMLFIEQGVTCTHPTVPLFSDWLNMGILLFLDLTDVAEFLKSLNILY